MDVKMRLKLLIYRWLFGNPKKNEEKGDKLETSNNNEVSEDTYNANTANLLANNVLPFKSRKLSNEHNERKRVMCIAKQIVNNFEKTADTAQLHPFYSWYYLLFYIQQRMIFSLSYLNYRDAVAYVEKEIVGKYKDYLMKKCHEWRDDGKTITKEEKNNQEKTIH